MLCIMNGAMASLSGGALGYVFGFGEVAQANMKDISLLIHSHRTFCHDGRSWSEAVKTEQVAS